MAGFRGVVQEISKKNDIYAIIPGFTGKSRDYCICLYDIFAGVGDSFIAIEL